MLWYGVRNDRGVLWPRKTSPLLVSLQLCALPQVRLPRLDPGLRDPGVVQDIYMSIPTAPLKVRPPSTIPPGAHCRHHLDPYPTGPVDDLSMPSGAEVLESNTPWIMLPKRYGREDCHLTRW